MGYRRFLLVNTTLVGLCIASFAIMTVDTPTWFRALHFFLFGTLNSLQFVGMNTLTLKIYLNKMQVAVIVSYQ